MESAETIQKPKRKYTRRAVSPKLARTETAPAPNTVGEIMAQMPPGTLDDARPDVRDDMRDEDPRARAERRAREWFSHIDSLPDGQDKYYIDPAKIPDGWTYEWKTHEVLGKQDPQYQVALAQTAWVAVPASRHPEMMPTGFSGATIDIGGMRLMERPEAITRYQRAKDERNARAPVENIRAKLAAAPAGHFERGTHPGAPVNIKSGYQPPEIPKS